MATQGTAGTASDAFGDRPGVLVIAHGAGAGTAAEEAALDAGLRVLRRVALADAAATLDAVARLDVVAIDCTGAPDGLVESAAAAVDRFAEESGAAVVALIEHGQIDTVAGRLIGRDRQLLCAPSPAEQAAALAMAKLTRRPQLNDASRDSESARLRRLNEEVARIADALARLTRGEEIASRGPVRAPSFDFRGQDGAAAGVTAAELRAVIRARRMRAQFLPGELFADPAWDMLLDLFAAEMERRQVSVSSLCIAAAVPPTTALRWIGTLHEAGLFERQADPSDRRRAYIGLSAKGLEGMRSYAGAVKRAGLHLV